MSFRKQLPTILLLLALLSLQAGAEELDQSLPAAAAGNFVTQLDSGAPADAWQQLTPLARIIKPQEQWQQLQQALRTAYGPLEKRTLRGVTLQNRFTMLPDGRYAIVQFDTVFSNKRTAVETIVLVLDEKGLWQVHDYISN